MRGGVVFATAGYGQEINFWDAITAKVIRHVNFADSQVNVLAISPDRLHLAAGGNPKIRLFETSTSNPNAVTEFEGHTGNVTAVGFHKDSKWIYSGSEDGTVRVFDTRTAGAQRTYETQLKSPVNSVALHPNQAQLIAADQSGTVSIFDLILDECVARARPETSDDVAMRSVSVAADGLLVAACNNVGRLFVWDMESPQTCVSIAEANFSTTEVHATYCLKCVISPDGKSLATASADQTVKIWKLPGMQLDRTLVKHRQWVHDIAFSADSNFLASASSDGSARLWDLATGDMIRCYTGQSKASAIVAVALNDNSRE